MTTIDDAPSQDRTRSREDLLGALEAVLMVVDEPVRADELATTLAVATLDVEAMLRELASEYAGWRVFSAPAFADVVDAYVVEGQTARLTQAALETLAVIAYRQPISRGRIGGIRGVNVESVVRTLHSRGLIEEAGHDAEGGAVLYRTTRFFLEKLGLRALDDLPPLAPYLPDMDGFDDVDGTLR
jgi:segregation and condensation protein B